MFLALFSPPFLMSACGQPKKPAPSASSIYVDKQLKIIEDHKKLLVDQGRMPVDFGNPERYLAEYGWHSGNESAPGNQPPLWLLQSGSRQGTGSYGAYTFSQRAFEQASKQWWIHGVMEKGSDILHPMNSNAKFDKSIIGHKISYMYKGVDDATVIGLPTYSDGSSMRVLQLDKKSPEFSMQWQISILSPDYVDLCGCTMSSTVTPSEPKVKPCIQGGTLGPGESCSVSVGFP